MDRGAWLVSPWGHKESDTTERLIHNTQKAEHGPQGLATISLLGVHPKGIQTGVHTKTFTQTFINTSLFKAPNSTLMGERTSISWYTHS